LRSRCSLLDSRSKADRGRRSFSGPCELLSFPYPSLGSLRGLPSIRGRPLQLLLVALISVLVRRTFAGLVFPPSSSFYFCWSFVFSPESPSFVCLRALRAHSGARFHLSQSYCWRSSIWFSLLSGVPASAVRFCCYFLRRYLPEVCIAALTSTCSSACSWLIFGGNFARVACESLQG
jgi:hypothetical protein